jgi:hypothetical protein
MAVTVHPNNETMESLYRTARRHIHNLHVHHHANHSSVLYLGLCAVSWQ